ncbi:protein TPR1-like isoform X3 [Oryza brachyantha]|uniref:protein TPR1-like isoform X3 n=1 Tax=Oryza brachyantha TaxID=4533 RepID=UPI0007768F10|nr:protein TPR1-like isoform X3 [Oryza brachyantha]
MTSYLHSAKWRSWFTSLCTTGSGSKGRWHIPTTHSSYSPFMHPFQAPVGPSFAGWMTNAATPGASYVSSAVVTASALPVAPNEDLAAGND